MKKKSVVRKKLRFFHTTVSVLIIMIVITGYYWTKVHEKYGLKRFTSFTHPYCMEPFVNFSKELSKKGLGNAWDVIADKEIGVEMHIPAEWFATANCRAHLCVSSPTFDGKQGQVVNIIRIDRRLGFPYEHYYADTQPANILAFLLGQKNCAYVKVGDLNGIRQTDREQLRRFVYAIDAASSSYIITTENVSRDSNADRMLEAIVANFRAIPIESKYVGDMRPYTGEFSPKVPYKNIVFDQRDVYEEKQIAGEFSETKIHGFTFTAFKGDMINFELLVPGSINPMSDTRIEIYSYGPTVLKGDSRLEWRVPVTGRYFLF